MFNVKGESINFEKYQFCAEISGGIEFIIPHILRPCYVIDRLLFIAVAAPHDQSRPNRMNWEKATGEDARASKMTKFLLVLNPVKSTGKTDALNKRGVERPKYDVNVVRTSDDLSKITPDTISSCNNEIIGFVPQDDRVC
jgi:hypothetical protein